MNVEIPGIADTPAVAAQQERMASLPPIADGDSPLAAYLQIVIRRRWIILACIAIGLAGGIATTLMTKRLYRAATTLEIARESARVLGTETVEPRSAALNQEFYQTQYGLLKSRSLATIVVKRLRLAENPTFLYGYDGGTPPQESLPLTPQRREQLERGAAGTLLAHLTIAPVRASSLVEVSFASPDPKLSADIVNALAESFITSNLSRRFAASAYARKFLEDRLTQVRAHLEESERALVDYAGKQRIINLDAPGSRNGNNGEAVGQSLTTADLSALNGALATATADRIAAEARYSAASQAANGPTSQAMQDGTSTSLRSARAELSAQYSKLLQQFKPDYPTMVALRQQIGELDRQINAGQATILGTIKNDYVVARKREDELQAKVDRLKDDVVDLRRRTIQYNIFQRDADTNRTLYEGLLQRYKEVGISGGIGTNNISVVDPALVPGGPFTPKPMLNLMIGLLAGLLVGAGIAFVLEQLDESIIAPDDLERKLAIPLLGNVPRMPVGSDTYAMLYDGKSVLSEAYLSVQTALRFSTRNGAPRALLVTSGRPAEGKSTTAIAIARNFASLGRKVVLIDGDLRNPSVHRVVSLPNVRGLSDLLAGGGEAATVIQAGDIDNLEIITSGPLPPNPAELLAGARLEQLVAQLLERVDHVVIDGPPVVGLADAPLMAAHVEATVFVIAASETRTRAARIALRRLADVRAHIVGAILTKFDIRVAGYGYGYGYGYDYDYGRKRGKGPA